jgi:hypothetical protein
MERRHLLACVNFQRGIPMKRNSSRGKSILLDDDFFTAKRYRIEKRSQDALDQYEELLDELDETPLPRTPKDFWSIATRLEVVSKALMAVYLEAR